MWSGFEATGPGRAFNLQVNEYNGEPHLSYWQGAADAVRGEGAGAGIILTQSYKSIARVKSINNKPAMDLHELHVLDGKRQAATAIYTIYKPTLHNWTMPDATVREIWVTTGMFQEVEVDTGRLVFEWSSINFVDPKLSTTPLNVTDETNNGLRSNTSWDYLYVSLTRCLTRSAPTNLDAR